MPDADPAALRSTPEERTAVSLTVYNGRFALVREVRPLALPAGRATLAFEGVPALIEPTSLNLVAPDAPDAFVVREQNYRYDLVGTHTVLDRAVGQRVRLTRHLDGGRIETVDGTLISQPDQGRVVLLDDGRVLVEPEGTIELAALPPGLVSRPTLVWALDVARAGRYDAEASYLTSGLSWKADYVAVLRADDKTLDLTGWVTLDNQSGATFEDAALQLMAGEVRRVQPPMQVQAPKARAMFVEEAAGALPFEEETFFEYHLYTLDGTTTLNNRETKQMTLLQAAGATARRRLVFDGAGTYYPWWHARPRRPGIGGATNEQAAAVVVELTNSEANNMGMPLPAGIVRVYQADRRGNLQFLGEDRIGHTPREEEVRLYVGDAFDVVGTRKVTASQRKLASRDTEHTVEIEVRNRKESGAADVSVIERLVGYWRITEESHAHKRLDAQTVEFAVSVPAGQTVTVRYTHRQRY